MTEEAVRLKRKAKVEEQVEKKPRLDSANGFFEVQPEVENFQREALWRSLQDYKRRAIQSQEHAENLQRTLNSNELYRKTTLPWFAELIDAIQIASSSKNLPDHDITSALIRAVNADDLNKAYQSYKGQALQAVRDAIKSKCPTCQTSEGLDNLNNQNLDIAERLRNVEARYELELKTSSEREKKLTEAQDRLASSQRKIDRQKSITLARIEAQAHRAPSTAVNTQAQPHTVPKETNNDQANIVDRASSTCNNIEHDKLTERVAQLRGRISELELDITRLQLDCDKSHYDLCHLSEADVQRTPYYKALQHTNETLQAQIDHLDSQNTTNAQLLLDLRTERTSFRENFMKQHDESYNELNNQLSKTEQDLARVRAARDDVHASLQIRKSQDDVKAASAREIGELADTQATRIIALEAEVARHKAQIITLNISEPINGHKQNDTESLLSQIDRLQKENESLKIELPTMEKAFNQAQDQNMRKIIELVSSEDKVAKLQAEKSKADQKYFAAMKSKDQVVLELRALKSQGLKQTEMCTKLQEVENSLVKQIQNLETQLIVAEQSLDQYKVERGKTARSTDNLQTLLTAAREETIDANKRMEALTTTSLTTKRSLLSLEEQNEATKKELSEILERNKDAQTATGDGDQMQVYRNIAMCQVCNVRWKETGLMSCGHVFCKPCIDKRIETRQRRCPTCNKGACSDKDITNSSLGTGMCWACTSNIQESLNQLVV